MFDKEVEEEKKFLKSHRDWENILKVQKYYVELKSFGTGLRIMHLKKIKKDERIEEERKKDPYGFHYVNREKEEESNEIWRVVWKKEILYRLRTLKEWEEAIVHIIEIMQDAENLSRIIEELKKVGTSVYNEKLKKKIVITINFKKIENNLMERIKNRENLEIILDIWKRESKFWILRMEREDKLMEKYWKIFEKIKVKDEDDEK